MVLPPACRVTWDISWALDLLRYFWWKGTGSLKLTQAGEVGRKNNDYKNAGVTHRTQVGMQPILRKALETGAKLG